MPSCAAWGETGSISSDWVKKIIQVPSSSSYFSFYFSQVLLSGWSGDPVELLSDLANSALFKMSLTLVDILNDISMPQVYSCFISIKA